MFSCGVHELQVVKKHETLFNTTTYCTIKGSTIVKVWVVASLSRVWTRVAFIRACAFIFTLALNHTHMTDITANTLTYFSTNAPSLFKHGYCFSVYVIPYDIKVIIIVSSQQQQQQEMCCNFKTDYNYNKLMYIKYNM